MTKTQYKKLAAISRATLILAVFTFLSRVLGLARDLILASAFGASAIADAYHAAFRVPDFIFNFFIIGTLTVAFLPIFNRELVHDEKKASELASSIFTISLVFITVVSTICFVAAPSLVDLVAPGFSGETRDMAITLTRVMMASPILFTLSNLAAVLLQSYNIFFPTALAPIFYNLGIISGVLFFYPIFGTVGLGMGVVLGALVHTAINVLPLRKIPLKVKLSFNLKISAVREVWKLYVPRLLAFDTFQVSLLVGSIVGSTLATGSIAIFIYAENLSAAPVGIFALSFAVAAFPRLSRAWAADKQEDFKKIIARVTIQILFFVVPLSAFIFILRAQVVRLLLGRGNFGWAETILTAQTLGVLSISIFAMSLTPLLSRAFYATHNTVIPVLVSLVSAALNVVLAVWLSKYFGVIGIGLATTVAAVSGFTLTAILLRLRIGPFSGEYMAEKILKILIATTVATTGVYATLYAVAPVINTRTTLGLLLQSATAAIIGLLLYLIVGLLLNLREARSFIIMTRLWILKLTKPLNILTTPFER